WRKPQALPKASQRNSITSGINPGRRRRRRDRRWRGRHWVSRGLWQWGRPARVIFRQSRARLNRAPVVIADAAAAPAPTAQHPLQHRRQAGLLLGDLLFAGWALWLLLRLAEVLGVHVAAGAREPCVLRVRRAPVAEQTRRANGRIPAAGRSH